MKRKAVVLLSSVLINLASFPVFADSKMLFGYFTDWGVYGRNYHADQIPINDLSGIVYAFAEVGNCATPYATDDNPTLCNASGQYGTATGVQDYKLYSADGYSDFNIIPANYKHANESGLGTMSKVLQKAHAQNKPVLLSIGGWTLSVPLRTAMDDAHRAAFIQSIIDFLNLAKNDSGTSGFDGIDIDFEPHDWTLITAQNITDYVNFLHDLKTALQNQYKPNALLTIATWGNPAVVNQIGKANWQSIAASVNYMNVMTYDYHAGWDNPQITNLLAPLHFDANQPDKVTGRTTFNADATIQAYLAQGINPQQLLFGFPAYGRAVNGVANIAPPAYPTDFGLYQNFTGIPNGEWDGDVGLFDYKYILKNMLTSGYVSYQLMGTSAAYNTNGTFLSYDNVGNIQTKAQYVADNHLGGMMVWELSEDVNPDDATYNQNSLVHAASLALNIGK